MIPHLKKWVENVPCISCPETIRLQDTCHRQIVQGINWSHNRCLLVIVGHLVLRHCRMWSALWHCGLQLAVSCWKFNPCLTARGTFSVRPHCVGRDSSVGILATGWTVWDWIPVGGKIIRTVQTGSGAHPAFYTVGTGSFPGLKWLGRGVDHPPSPNAEVQERVELYLYPPFGPFWPGIGWPLPLLRLRLTQQTEGLLNEFVC